MSDSCYAKMDDKLSFVLRYKRGVLHCDLHHSIFELAEVALLKRFSQSMRRILLEEPRELYQKI